jgi:3',5'-cyclic AMP phosphodiesterase CpdA
MRIAQISDFHFTKLTCNPFRLISKRILGHINWLIKRRNAFSVAQLEALPPLFQELGVDLILFGGDFTTTSMKEEYEQASYFVKQFSQPYLAIPGNHDHYTRSSFKKKAFYRTFPNPLLQETGVEARCIKPNWWVVSLDTIIATNIYSSQGLFSEKLEKELKTTLDKIPSTDSIILFNHYPFFDNDDIRHSLIRGDALQKLIESDPRIRLYLHGHTHRNTIANLQPNNLPIVLDGGSCAQTKNGAWNLIDINDQECTISSFAWNGSWQKNRKETYLWR